MIVVFLSFSRKY